MFNVLILVNEHLEGAFFEPVKEPGLTHQLVLMIVAVVLSEQDGADERSVLRREIFFVRIAMQQQVVRAVLHTHRRE